VFPYDQSGFNEKERIIRTLFDENSQKSKK
jgi:hypothetical protein